MISQIRVIGASVLIFGLTAGWLYTINRAKVQAANKVHAEYAVILADLAKKTAKVAEKYRETEQFWVQMAHEEAENGAKELAKAQSAAARARAESDRLRIAYRNKFATACTSPDPAAPVGGTGIKNPAAINLSTDVLGRIDEAAGELAEYADKLRIAGSVCVSISDRIQQDHRLRQLSPETVDSSAE